MSAGENAKKSLLSKRFRPLYAAAFLQGIIFWYSIEKLFMKSIGFDDRAIALSIIIFTVVTIIANIPIGILADRWSRVGVLYLASLEMVAACLIAGFSDGFWVYAVAAGFSALFFASYQGAYDSIVYDTLIEEKVDSKEFNRYYGRLRMYDGAALIVGSLLSAAIVHFLDLRAAYFLTIPFALISVIMLYLFKEPKEHKKDVRDVLSAHIGATFKAVTQNKRVLIVTFNLVLITTVCKLVLDFDQLWFIALALPLVLYGPFDAILLSSFAVGSFISERIRRDTVALWLCLLSLISAFVLLIHQAYFILIAQTIIVTAMVVYTIIFERHLHDNIASRVRVGATSMVNTIAYIIFLPIAFLTGYISDRYGIFHVAWIVIVLLALLLASSIKEFATQRQSKI